MLIVIPTYKRNACLRWVLQSLVQCRTKNIDEPIRVVVVNNYPPAKDEINAIVGEFSHNNRFIWDVLYREKTLPPVENWYSAIFEYALLDEVVLINSDDDLFFPWSLEVRFKEIDLTQADMLLARIDTGLYFSQQVKRVYYKCKLPIEEKQRARILTFENVYSYSPQHLSNHCYRNTKNFRDGFNKAINWCHAQDWLDFNNRTLFITLYLPYALLLSGGKVAGLNSACVLRGRDSNEIRLSKYGIPNWNHGFIHLCALGVLGNQDLKDIAELNALRNSYSDEFVRWFATCLFDHRLDRSLLWETLERVSFPVSKIFSPKVLYGITLVIKDLLRLRGLRLQHECKRNSIPTEKFIERMAVL